MALAAERHDEDSGAEERLFRKAHHTTPASEPTQLAVVWGLALQSAGTRLATAAKCSRTTSPKAPPNQLLEPGRVVYAQHPQCKLRQARLND
jgi:hypothetical protein